MLVLQCYIKYRISLIRKDQPFTCSGVDGEEILRITSSNAITQAAGFGRKVRVLRLYLNDWHILWRVLHDDWMVDRIRSEGGIIVDIFNLKGTERGWKKKPQRHQDLKEEESESRGSKVNFKSTDIINFKCLLILN